MLTLRRNHSGMSSWAQKALDHNVATGSNMWELMHDFLGPCGLLIKVTCTLTHSTPSSLGWSGRLSFMIYIEHQPKHGQKAQESMVVAALSQYFPCHADPCLLAKRSVSTAAIFPASLSILTAEWPEQLKSSVTSNSTNLPVSHNTPCLQM